MSYAKIRRKQYPDTNLLWTALLQTALTEPMAKMDDGKTQKYPCVVLEIKTLVW